MCKKIDNMDKWKSRHLIAFLAIGRTRFFPSCEKLIPSKTLKLSAAVHSHFKDILKYEKYENKNTNFYKKILPKLEKKINISSGYLCS